MKLAVLLSIFVASFCLFNSLTFTEGCSCQRQHPQDHYCRAHFVIKAHVRRVKTVKLLPDGSIRHMKKSNAEDQKVHVGPEVPTKRPLLETHKTLDGESELDVKPAPFGRPEGFPGPESGGVHTTGVNGASPGGPGPVSSIGDIDSKEDRAKRSAGRIIRDAHGVGLPPGKTETIARPAVQLLQYKIDIVKVFKGLGNVTKLGRNFLYTSTGSFVCKKALNNASYMLMGQVVDDRMHISLCDYSLELNEEASSEEKRNLVRNLRGRFSQGCVNCRVHVCNPFGKCPAERLDSSTCLWKDWLNFDTMEANQHACMQSKAGKCKWYNALKKVRKGRAKM